MISLRRAAMIAPLLALSACAASRDAAAPESPQATAAQPGGMPEASGGDKSGKDDAAKKEEPEGKGIDESDPVVALAEAEGELDRALRGQVKTADPARTPPGGATPPRETPLGAEAGACSIACRALASMRRSADRLCGLAGGAPADGLRCEDARTRVTRAEERVKQRCSACADPG